MTWSGPRRHYDLVKELVLCLAAVTALTLLLAAVFSSPDVKQVTLASWASSAPDDFVATAATELDGTSGSATYGAPYSRTPGAEMKLGPLGLQTLAGVTHPIDTAQDFVLGPLSAVADDPDLSAALTTYRSASADQQQGWATAYDEALQAAPDLDPAKVAPGEYGPVPVLLGRLERLATSGGLDGALLLQHRFYQTDYTSSLLFLADGTYLEELATAQHLGGEQWGMMNETGNYPGQPWLWLYTFWYQVKPFSTSDNADALVWGLMMVLTAGLALLPFIPGLRSVPKRLGVHRLIWRDWYRSQEDRSSGS
jgi:hypothetical protein